MHRSASMAWVRGASLLAGALLVGCGSSASLEFANEGPSTVDGGDPNPYPDTGSLDPDAPPSSDGLVPDAGELPKCTPGMGGKGNVCVRVIRAADGPSITADSKDRWGLDGKGAVLIGLASLKPSTGEVAFVAQTWFPTESSGAGKLAATELPKMAELPVLPGTYWAFAMFRDQEPFMRSGVAIGDYIPRMAELPQVTVTEGGAINIDVKVYPVRAVDVEVHLTASPAGSGAGPAHFWIVDDSKKVMGEGGASCLDLSGGKSEIVRLYTTDTGAFGVAGALFDYGAAGYDPSGTLPSLPPGALYTESPLSNTVTIAPGDWLAPTRRRVDLDKLVSLSGAKPADPSLNCAAEPYVAPK